MSAKTVLLVEDDEACRTLGVTILRYHGYHVLEAGAGEHGVWRPGSKA